MIHFHVKKTKQKGTAFDSKWWYSTFDFGWISWPCCVGLRRHWYGQNRGMATRSLTQNKNLRWTKSRELCGYVIGSLNLEWKQGGLVENILTITDYNMININGWENKKTLLLLLLLFGFSTKHLAMMVPISCPTVWRRRPASFKLIGIDQKKNSLLFSFSTITKKGGPTRKTQRGQHVSRIDNRQKKNSNPKKETKKGGTSWIHHVEEKTQIP